MEPPASALPDPRVGRVLQGRYRILSLLASGAMGVVYKGERMQLGRPVAVKFLHPWIASQKAFLGRFENEARAMSRLAHPHCVSVIDFGVESQPYLVMDFVTGTTLREVLQAGPLPVARALHILRQLLAGLSHAHAQGIIHRDLKPDNIILGDEAGLQDHLRILDFGLAKLRDGPAMTAGLAIGTPSYMSPEQTGADGEIDARSDLYAVGVLMFELLTGVKPFRSDHVGDLLLMHREARPPSINGVRPDARVSEALEQVVQRALAKSPADRFQSAAEFSQALEQTPEGQRVGAAPAPVAGAVAPTANAGATTAAAVGQSPVASSPRARSRRRGRMAGVVLVAAALAALVTGVLLRRGGGPGPAPARLAEQRATAPRPLAPAAGESKGAAVSPAPTASTPVAPSPPPAPSTNVAPAASADYAQALASLQARRWAEGLGAAEKAVRASPALKSDPALLNAVIQALASDPSEARAQAFLRRAGAAAIPAIKEAARHDASPKVRTRAAELLDEGRGRSLFGSTPRSSSSSSSSSSFFKR